MQEFVRDVRFKNRVKADYRRADVLDLRKALYKSQIDRTQMLPGEVRKLTTYPLRAPTGSTGLYLKNR